MMDRIGPGSLKIVVVESAAAEAAERVLRERVGDVRPFGPGAWLVFGEASTADIRDWLVERDHEAGVFVAEFERWSSHGQHVDARWLSRRGH